MSLLGLVAGIAIARNKGVPSSDVVPDALVGSLFRSPIMGIVLVSALAQNQASSASAVATSGASISQLLPNFGKVGDPVTIVGTNFGAAGSAVTVTFGGVSAGGPIVDSPTTIAVDVPDVSKGAGVNAATNVPVVVTVGTVASAPQMFTVIPNSD